MKPSDYQLAIKRTDHNEEGYQTRLVPRLTETRTAQLVHYAIGLSEETGEILGPIKKYIRDGRPIDVQNMKEECGDICWYLGNLLTLLGSSFEEVMQLNIDKLKARYPEGFDEKWGLTRNKEAEAKVLEES